MHSSSHAVPGVDPLHLRAPVRSRRGNHGQRADQLAED
jgi:hypothetical protein